MPYQQGKIDRLDTQVSSFLLRQASKFQAAPEDMKLDLACQCSYQEGRDHNYFDLREKKCLKVR